MMIKLIAQINLFVHWISIHQHTSTKNIVGQSANDDDDDCGRFKAKQILSLFLEYLMEQSLLVQHEYKRP